MTPTTWVLVLWVIAVLACLAAFQKCNPWDRSAFWVTLVVSIFTCSIVGFVTLTKQVDQNDYVREISFTVHKDSLYALYVNVDGNIATSRLGLIENIDVPKTVAAPLVRRYNINFFGCVRNEQLFVNVYKK